MNGWITESLALTGWNNIYKTYRIKRSLHTSWTIYLQVSVANLIKIIFHPHSCKTSSSAQQLTIGQWPVVRVQKAKRCEMSRHHRVNCTYQTQLLLATGSLMRKTLATRRKRNRQSTWTEDCNVREPGKRFTSQKEKKKREYYPGGLTKWHIIYVYVVSYFGFISVSS